jgi:hypothetical protein
MAPKPHHASSGQIEAANPTGLGALDRSTSDLSHHAVIDSTARDLNARKARERSNPSIIQDANDFVLPLAETNDPISSPRDLNHTFDDVHLLTLKSER